MSKQSVGLKLTEQSLQPVAEVGEVYIDKYGRQFQYCRANGDNTAGRWAIIATDGTYDATPMTTTLVGTPGTDWKLGGVACCDITDNYYGWFWIGYGEYEAIIENGFSAAEVLYSTANAGIPGSNSSSVIIDGVMSIDAGVTATRVTVRAAGRITYGLTACND